MSTIASDVRVPAHAPRVTAGSCRFCGQSLETTFVDLGMSPLCESYVTLEQLGRGEMFYPLHAYVCGRCFLVQLQEFVAPADIFSEYAYFSSFSDTWLEHARRYCAAMIDRFELDRHSSVVELASNDGYLLRNFVAHGIPVLGVEPAANVADVAIQQGIATCVDFFGQRLAERLASGNARPDLIVANNVLAQVPDVNDFVEGIRILLAPEGVATIEFPHLLTLMREQQFDTIYHEHFSYFSFSTAERIFGAHGLRVFDVDELPTHGGSLRLYVAHEADGSNATADRVAALRKREFAAGLANIETYGAFAEQVKRAKRELLQFAIAAKGEGKSIAGYGAPGKGNTLLNYCGIRTDVLDYTVDRNPYKQGKFTPGTRIPIHAPQRIFETKPDYVLILPWNVKDEIMAQMADIAAWGGKFVVPIPEVTIVDPQ